MTGYGEPAWYDPNNHTQLHADLVSDFASTHAAIDRRPNLKRSVLACDECQRIYRGDDSGASSAAAPEYGRRVRMVLHLPELHHALGIPADHQALYLWVEHGETVTLTVQCPPAETGECPLAAAAAAVIPPQ